MKPEDLTAWALDELSPEDRASVESALGANEKTQQGAHSTQAFCALLRRELMDESLALKPEQRSAILACRSSAQPGREPAFRPRPLRWFQRPAIPMAAAAAVIVLGGLAALQLSQSFRDADPLRLRVEAERIRISGAKRSNSELSKSADVPLMPGKLPAAVPSLAVTVSPGAPPPPPVLNSSNPLLEAMTLAAGPADSGVVGGGVQLRTDSKPSLRFHEKEAVHGIRRSKAAGNAEDGDPIIESALISVAREPLATFPLDVDTASYANVRQLLKQGIHPPRDAVRIEELINGFPTSDPGPAPEATHPLLVKAEMAECPWQPGHRLVRIHLKARDLPGGVRPGTLVTVARDVKVQLEFNPAAVREYRWIGCENRQPARSASQDAGAVRAGHSVVALYELVPAVQPPGGESRALADRLRPPPAEIRLAAPLPPGDSALEALEALTVKVRYKAPDANVSRLIELTLKDEARAVDKAGGEFKFTAAVAGFGLLLRESPYAGLLNWDEVRRLAREGKGEDALGFRAEFLQLIEKAAAR